LSSLSNMVVVIKVQTKIQSMQTNRVIELLIIIDIGITSKHRVDVTKSLIFLHQGRIPQAIFKN
jgi:hypothetical protein